MINSIFSPATVDAFDKNKLKFNAQGVSANITAGTVQNIDLTLTDDHLITGGWLITNGSNLGDFCSFQVIDSTGAFSGTPGTVLSQFISNWYLNTNTDIQFEIQYPAKIYATLTLRIVYTSTGTTNPFVGINYKLHKVLI